MENNAQKFDSVEQKSTAEGLSKEELGRLVASRWTGENPNEPSPQENDVDDEEKFHNDHELHDEHHLHDDDFENEQEEEDSSTDDEDGDEYENPDAYDHTDVTQAHTGISSL